MIDYADAILKLKIGERKLHNLLLSRKIGKEAADVVDDCIVALIEIKQYIQRNQVENHKQI
jgi:hypothetical protein